MARRSDGDSHRAARDTRHSFAKDRDRLLYAGSFRRLAGKSQVVASTELGPFHTRLTHSLKVAQLGRRIAEGLRRGHNTAVRTYAPDPDLVEFACLAHDIGHPPFGHAGERELHKTLDTILLGEGDSHTKHQLATTTALDLGGFEGNPQSFRIVTRLAHKWLNSDGEEVSDLPTDWFGLDLTAASMDAVSKYPWGRNDLEQRKWGVYGSSGDASSDFAALRWARDKFGASLGEDQRRSFECQLMDWCDDVTYAVHDVDDFFQIGLIPLDLLFADDRPPDDSPEWVEFRTYVQEKWTNRGIAITSDELNLIRQSLVENANGLTISGRFTDSAKDRRFAHFRANQLIEHFVGGVWYEGEPLLHSGNFLLDKSPTRANEIRLQCDLLQELIWKYIIDSPSLATQQAGHRKIVRDLVMIYNDEDDLLPRHHRDMLAGKGVGYSGSNRSEVYARVRIAADYVASLTEPHAAALHHRLTGAELGGFRDLI